MANITERHNPSWVLWPANCNTTAWREFGLPLILVVPHARDAGGRPISNSAINNVTIVIEGAPTEALVAGHDHVGMRFPDREVYRRTLTSREILGQQIDTDLLEYQTADGTPIDDPEDIKEGVLFRYTTASGVFDTLQFFPDANYFDLSDILIETEGLPPRHYNLIYTCEFALRVVTKEQTLGINELICVDANRIGQSSIRFGLNHPGEVILEFYNHTPATYLTNAIKSQDSTISFYRPFTAVLQDIYDEQSFIQGMLR